MVFLYCFWSERIKNSICAYMLVGWSRLLETSPLKLYTRLDKLVWHIFPGMIIDNIIIITYITNEVRDKSILWCNVLWRHDQYMCWILANQDFALLFNLNCNPYIISFLTDRWFDFNGQGILICTALYWQATLRIMITCIYHINDIFVTLEKFRKECFWYIPHKEIGFFFFKILVYVSESTMMNLLPVA